MSADRPHPVLSLLLAGTVSMAGGTARATEEVPEPAFLEYLGMWEESDEEWLLVRDGVERETDASPQPEESPENVDEQDSEG